MLATDDPALRAALRAAFAPRGMEVVDSERTLRSATDVLEGAPETDPVVWVCRANGGEALCVRKDGNTRVVRQVSMAQPLAPEDAAALTLSVEVALWQPPPEASPPAADERAATPPVAPPPPTVQAAAAPAPVPPVAPPFALTFEVTGGARTTPITRGARLGLELVYAPPFLGRRLGLGAGVSTGSSDRSDDLSKLPLRQRDSWARPSDSIMDRTVRLFARGRLPMRRLGLSLDLGPTLHFVRLDAPELETTARSVEVSADAVLGVVIAWSRFFIGGRVGTSYLMTEDDLRARPEQSRWGAEAGVSAGVGFR